MRNRMLMNRVIAVVDLRQVRKTSPALAASFASPSFEINSFGAIILWRLEMTFLLKRKGLTGISNPTLWRLEVMRACTSTSAIDGDKVLAWRLIRRMRPI